MRDKVTIRNVIFDYGNVLSYSQQPSDVESMAKVAGVPPARFQELYWKFRMPYDRADTDGEAYWQTVAGEEGLQFSKRQIEELTEIDTQGWARQNKHTALWVKKLNEAGLRLGLLSNMPSDLRKYVGSTCEWVPHFHHLTFSCDVRLVKPDAAIYESCLKSLNARAEETLFLDDLAPNIEAAAKVGIHGVIFDTLEKTAARVQERFHLPLPDSYPE